MMDDQFLIHTLIIMAGIESKQPGAMPLEDNPLFVAAERLKEMDALKAQVELLREQLEYMAQQHRCGCGHPACNRCYDDKQNAIVLEATPAKCLAVHDAEIKAQAVEEILSHFGNKFRANEKLTVKNVCWMLNEHLKQLRQQAKG